MRKIQITADELVLSLLELSKQRQVCFLDSCAQSHLESHFLIAGIEPIETLNISNENPHTTLEIFDQKLSQPDLACIFTISYEFGLKLENIKSRPKEFRAFTEPDIFLAVFDCLIVHDYHSGETFLVGNTQKFNAVENLLLNSERFSDSENFEESKITSNFTVETYISTVKKIKEYIKNGDTYQTNLTQQIRAELPENLTAQQIFYNLRKTHPAPFAAFIKRNADFVVSISPERFIKIQKSKISTSPIKGTQRRGKNENEDSILRNKLLKSQKDLAENVMIVDLLRNDLGRICEFGSIEVEKLCDLELHPTLFHLVSTVSGELRDRIKFSEILKAVFPCGSITGAPKIRTMRIIDELETAARGLSMGAIGFKSMDEGEFQMENKIDLSVAIRTMVVRGREAIFNVGGGIVIDSNPEDEYAESLLKAQALMKAINGKL